MLRVAKVRSGGHAYYLEVAGGPAGPGIEAPGRWLGVGAPPLSLSGVVQPAPFVAVLAGEHPDTGEVLGTARARVRGGRLRYDLRGAEVGEHPPRPRRRRRGGRRRRRTRRSGGGRHVLRRASGPGRRAGRTGRRCRRAGARRRRGRGRFRPPGEPGPRSPPPHPRRRGQCGPWSRGSLERARRPRRLRPRVDHRLRSITSSCATNSPAGWASAWDPPDRGRADISGIGPDVRREFSRRAAEIAAHWPSGRPE